MIFVLEALLKIFAHRGLPYFKDKWNVFDFMLVLISVAELIYIGILSSTLCGENQGESHIGTALRTFRLVRSVVFKRAARLQHVDACRSVCSHD